MEALLRDLLPGLDSELSGATEEEVAQIEELAGRPLPRFYRWFLLRMGRRMGTLGYATIDFSAPTVLASYEEQLFHANGRFLMIGRESDEMMPLHVLYDFDHLARDDARVTKSHALGGGLHHQFDTFREMLGWGAFMLFHVEAMPQRCVGLFHDVEGDVLARLDPVLRGLGFTSLLPTGSHCSLYRSARASIVTRCSPGIPPEMHTFRLGGPDAAHLRRILGVIGCETAMRLEVDEWLPRLPTAPER